jgi:hypothetical protein
VEVAALPEHSRWLLPLGEKASNQLARAATEPEPSAAICASARPIRQSENDEQNSDKEQSLQDRFKEANLAR